MLVRRKDAKGSTSERNEIMDKIKKILVLFLAILISTIIVLSVIFINWEHIFGDTRPIANAKAMYQLEFKDKNIAETTDVDNNIMYIVPKGHLDTYIEMMQKKGYSLTEKDNKNHTLLLEKRNNFTEISYKSLTSRYTIISSPFLKKV